MDMVTFRNNEKLIDLGLSKENISELKSISKILSGFYERCCNDLSFNEDTGKYDLYCHLSGKIIGTYPDIETKCINRIENIINSVNDRNKDIKINYYLQTDPRGLPIYIYDIADIGNKNIHSCYSSFATAILE